MAGNVDCACVESFGPVTDDSVGLVAVLVTSMADDLLDSSLVVSSWPVAGNISAIISFNLKKSKWRNMARVLAVEREIAAAAASTDDDDGDEGDSDDDNVDSFVCTAVFVVEDFSGFVADFKALMPV